MIATGARPRTLPCSEGIAGVHTLRTVDDARQLRAALHGCPRRVAVLGASFIGSEVAATARTLGLDVSLIDAAALPMLAAVGQLVGGFGADLHRRHGVDLRLGVAVRAVSAAGGRLQAVELSDGTAIESDLAVMGLGVQPNVEWLAGSGLQLDDGVRADAALRALDAAGDPVPGVVTAGDVARWPHPLFDDEPIRVEHWSNAVDQGAAAGDTLLHHLTGTNTEGRRGSPGISAHTHSVPTPFDGVPTFWSDQYDAKILSVGLPALATTCAVLDGDLADGRFVVGYGRRGRLVGAVSVNYPRRLAAYRRHVAARGSWPPPPAPAPPSRAPTRAQPGSRPGPRWVGRPTA